MKDQNEYKPVIARAKVHLARLAVGVEFDWRQLFGEVEWSDIAQRYRPQTVGETLGRVFSSGDRPIIEFVRINTSPRKSIHRKIREVDERD